MPETSVRNSHSLLKDLLGRIPAMGNVTQESAGEFKSAVLSLLLIVLPFLSRKSLSSEFSSAQQRDLVRTDYFRHEITNSVD